MSWWYVYGEGVGGCRCVGVGVSMCARLFVCLLVCKMSYFWACNSLCIYACIIRIVRFLLFLLQLCVIHHVTVGSVLLTTLASVLVDTVDPHAANQVRMYTSAQLHIIIGGTHVCNAQSIPVDQSNCMTICTTVLIIHAYVFLSCICCILCSVFTM